MRLMGTMKIQIWVGIVLLLLSLLVGGLAGSLVTARGRLVPVYLAGKESGNRVSLEASFAPIIKDVAPAVVNIYSSKIIRARDEAAADPLWRQFFGEEPWRRLNIPRERREQSLGSGVIISPDGYILTNNHVVENATNIKVFLADGREFKAQVVGADPKTDIAVLKVEAEELPAITLGDSSAAQVGDIVLAIGNPFGIGQTVTMGIISAIGQGAKEGFEDFIQTDAAINAGNSGGALINARGELIGINTAIFSNAAQGSRSMGFAVPINLARRVMEQILKHGKVVRGFVGISLQPVTQTVAKAFGLSEARGALVGDVAPDGPAARAGITKGDIILALNGERIAQARDLQSKLSRLPPGATIRLRVFRDGRERDVAVTVGAQPERSEPSESALEGLTVNELTPKIARQLNLPAQAKGLVIVSVQPGSAAAEAGLERGDLIQEVNRKPVTTIVEFEQAVRQTKNESVLLLINRAGSTSYVVVEPR